MYHSRYPDVDRVLTQTLAISVFKLRAAPACPVIFIFDG